jgi:AraC-like DNA-binding protein
LLDGYPRLTLAAEIAGTSTRTLQRRLAADGLSYSELIDRARFDIASRMLVETDARSIEIAQATAYSDPSHFARAFRRIAGLSPDEYRTQARQRVTQ